MKKRVLSCDGWWIQCLQVEDEVKKDISEEAEKAAREMAEQALSKRLEEIVRERDRPAARLLPWDRVLCCKCWRVSHIL
eukprot:COSAG06_NODE_978_length_11240_cov_3.328606_4_plen_79_part_00